METFISVVFEEASNQTAEYVKAISSSLHTCLSAKTDD